MAKDGSDSHRSPKSPLINSRLSKARDPDSSSDPTTPQTPSNTKPAWTEGSWRGKASAVAGLARQSTSSNPTLDKAPVADSSGRPTQPLSQGLNTPSKAGPSVASTSEVNAVSAKGKLGKTKRKSLNVDKAMKQDSSQLRDLKHNVPKSNDPASSVGADGSKDSTKTLNESTEERPAPASGWRGWWSRREAQPETRSDEATSTPGTDQATLAALEGHTPVAQLPTDARSEAPEDARSSQTADAQSTRSSWFGLLGSMTTSQPAGDQTSPGATQKGELPKPSPSTYNATPEAPYQSKLPDRPASGSTWAFWMRDSGSAKTGDTNQTEPKKDQVGELAVSGTKSQSKPQIASMSPEPLEAEPVASKKRPLSSATLESAKRKSTGSNRGAESTEAEPQSEVEVPAAMQESVLRTTLQPEQPQQPKSKPPSVKQKPDPPNIVLPDFESMYPPSRPPSYWSKIAWVIGRGTAGHARHLTIAPSPHKIKRALAIGVHGLFPSPMLQKILGPPTGTSIKFAEGAAEAVRNLTQAQGYSCEIEKVALEGEGVIADRIDTLWKLLLNWIDHIRKADFIFVACHSQGVPVAVSLVAKLLNFGCVQQSTRIGICGMAGVNLGPFPSYQSRFLAGSAAELFSLSNGASPASQAYASALALVLAAHVRILYAGSIDDQLVSLESATFANVAHPYVARAVYVDGRLHAPDFLTRLVGFALKLRNLGVSDHGLVRELSGPLAGSLYGGEGHSRIYEEGAVYALALRHALETETLDGAANPPLEVRPYEVGGSGAPNPYFLPWAMRGVLEEEFVRTELKGETEELLGLFDAWRPQSKVLKDVKFRLEAVKSKL